MAKVAFDVQGTLKGRHSAKIVQFFKFLEARGHEMYIWSFGGYGMARDAADDLELEAKCMAKTLAYRDEPLRDMDVCIDDEDDCGLSARQEISVLEVPSDPAELEAFAVKYGL